MEKLSERGICECEFPSDSDTLEIVAFVGGG